MLDAFGQQGALGGRVAAALAWLEAQGRLPIAAFERALQVGWGGGLGVGGRGVGLSCHTTMPLQL